MGLLILKYFMLAHACFIGSRLSMVLAFNFASYDTSYLDINVINSLIPLIFTILSLLMILFRLIFLLICFSLLMIYFINFIGVNIDFYFFIRYFWI